MTISLRVKLGQGFTLRAIVRGLLEGLYGVIRVPSGCPEPLPHYAPGFRWVHVGALPCHFNETAPRGYELRGRGPSERDRRTLSAVLCVWVLVSERGLEPPRGVKPHQVLSLARLTFPSRPSAPL